jgi:DNA-directed RNA polymerase subunit RPC12/RpoP
MAVMIFPIVLVAAGFLFQFQLQRQRTLTDMYGYRCGNCGNQFDLSPLAATFAPPRTGGSKFVRCPSCGARAWAARVPR